MFVNLLEYATHWPKPNYDHPEVRGNEIWIITALLLAISTLAICVRLWQRVWVRRFFGMDDLLIIFSWLCLIGIAVFVGKGNVHFGWDRHLWDLRPESYSGSAFNLYVSRLMWSLATSFVRLSVICLYYRLLKAADAPQSYFIVNHVMLISTLTLLLYYIFSQIFICNPVRGYWAWPPIPGQHCHNDGLSILISAAVNTASDFVVATLPWLAIYGLGVDSRQKWDVIGVLCVGYVVVIAGSVRCYYFYMAFLGSWDITWYSTPFWLSTEVELALAIMCACAASIRPVVTRIHRSFQGTRVHRFFRGLWRSSPETPHRYWFASRDTTIHSQAAGSTTKHYEDMSQWQMEMSRTIDLEGIRADGLGYSVKITGPTKAEALKRVHGNLERLGLTKSGSTIKRPRKLSFKLNKDTFEGAGSNSSGQDTRLNIITEMEVNVRESWHSTRPTLKAWDMAAANNERPDYEDIEDIFQNFVIYQGSEDDKTTVRDGEGCASEILPLAESGASIEMQNSTSARLSPESQRLPMSRYSSDVRDLPKPSQYSPQSLHFSETRRSSEAWPQVEPRRLSATRRQSELKYFPKLESDRYQNGPESLRLEQQRRDLSLNPNFFESKESIEALPQVPGRIVQARGKG